MDSNRFLADFVTLFILFSHLGTNGINALIKPGRRVCPVSRASSQVVPSQQTYIRPFNVACNNDDCGNTSRIIYKVATRTVFYRQVVHDYVRKCCPGWISFKSDDQDCMKPLCLTECLHGGNCSGPEYCTCPRNYTGAHCEIDVDECQTGRHDCQHLCNNTIGGYTCDCFDGYRLVNDRQCQFCPLCLKEFEHVMNTVDELQTRLKSVESSKEDIQKDFSNLQQNYKDALDKVGELQDARIKYTMTTKSYLHDEGRVNTQSNFDLITSLSDQMGAIEEQIGYMMRQIGSRKEKKRRPRKNRRRRP